MKPGWLLATLRTALAAVPGPITSSQPFFPTLPLLEATEFGQQHIITTFCLGPPPPTLVMPTSGAQPAVTLHLIWPQGYTYWQPETGTHYYLGGVRTIEELPPDYQLLLRSYSAQHLAPPASAVSYEVDMPTYLLLLEEVLAQQWLEPHAAISMAEKATAMQLKQVFAQVTEPVYQAYYQSRGKALFSWIERAIYEPNWVETALDKALATSPNWLESESHDVLPTPPFVAVLDGRPCLVATSYRHTAGSPTTGQPVAACYISYPEQEVRWRQFDSPAYATITPLATPLPKESALTTPTPSADSHLTNRRYLQLLTLVLSRAWLVNRYPTTAEEKAVATELQPYVATLFPAALHAYYQRDAWQLLRWLARTAT
jgi:hypothetical protein